ncbi:MAG TPA: ABC transporter permease [Gemmataceae bacterium]|nr:ABC transporter permease [Gemmataceae bacterium]
MYKLLLCWRYLLTRYLALACIISVMLGVATLIVVNSVMSGFSTKLRDRLHGLLSDVVIEANSLEGFSGPAEKMAKIRSVPYLNERIQAMSATMEVFAMLQFRYPNGERVTRMVKLIGIDPKSRDQVGGFKEHLVYQKKNAEASFAIPQDVKEKYENDHLRLIWKARAEQREVRDEEGRPPPEPTPLRVTVPCGVIVGNLLASYREKDPDDPAGNIITRYLLTKGQEVILTTVGGQKLAPVYDNFVVVDYFESEMSEYDSQYVFVPLDYLQRLRAMPDRVSSIQIKLKNYQDAKDVVETLKMLFPFEGLSMATWEQKQGPLLHAIAIEKGILNVLLFLIIGVAGFGILAIFTMIVAEKTRDIGILKALGASNWGVLKIFVTYGLLLGVVGAWLGTLLGVSLTNNINKVENFLSRLTGSHIFDPGVYYFNQIPTDIQVWMVVGVNLGAVGIAVLFSVLPALRAALLHPVRALRYE